MPRRLEYAASLDREGRLLVDGGSPLEPGEEWTPEHLLLAALMRCTLKSLGFHAERRSLSVRGAAAAEGVVTKREADGRYALVEVECGLDIDVEPLPEGEALAELLGLAERDCFVGHSLTAKPRYEWRVNGELVSV
ncbi:MAG TPA: OsmC family protein [Gaiellaceae bacterium]|nr:OsmC family protein [Gaiellaceae bacterium]